VTPSVTRDQVLRYRARVSHLDERLPPGSFARAAWGGLQDTAPRSGVLSLHARVTGTNADSWEDPSIVQVWFRGADYLIPREDVGVFTLGAQPRDRELVRRLEKLADRIEKVTQGEILRVGEVAKRLGLPRQPDIRPVALTGRAVIRWDASNIWLIPTERPRIDVEDARRELARRFVHWFGPTTVSAMARWTGVPPRDARETWAGIERELTPVELDGDGRYMLTDDIDVVRTAEPVAGVRLLPYDDPFGKLDRTLLVREEIHRNRVFPPVGQSVGHIPGPILVDGEIVGTWQRQQRKVAIHPWKRLPKAVREAIEAEALAFPIASNSKASVTWA
jgi:hypothetical protein